jgi:peptide/nickel transport system substrate-binding protein
MNASRMRLILIATVLAASLALLSSLALAQEPRFGGTLRVAQASNVPTLDPHSVTHLVTREIGMQIFEGLFTFSERFEVIPQLAESYELSDDGLTYTIRLRQGVPFHNGEEMTSDDVEASLTRFLEISPRRGELAALAEIEVVDDYTLRLHLSQPSGAFLAALANPIAQLAILPREAVEGRAVQEADLIGTGPYRFVEWIPDRNVRVARFEEYAPNTAMPASGFGGERVAYLDEIYFIPVPELGSRVAGLQTGEYHFVDSVSAGDARRLADLPNVEVVQIVPYNWPAVYFNHSPDRIFSDLRMRQAVQAALDHEEIMLVASEGTGRLDPGMYFVEQVWHSDVGGELYDQRDLEKAQRLLAEAGYQGQEIVLVTNTDNEYMYQSALVMQQQLQRAGMNVRLEVYDWPGSLERRRDLNAWDMFTSGHSTRFDPTANDFYFRPATTFFAYDNPELVAHLDAAAATTDFEERYANYEAAQRILYEDVAWLKLFDLFLHQAHLSSVEGYNPWVMSHFTNVWLSE